MKISFENAESHLSLFWLHIFILLFSFVAKKVIEAKRKSQIGLGFGRIIEF